NSSKEPRFVPATKTRGAWFPANLATAALLALTLVGIFYAFGPGRPSRTDRQALVPRIYYTPSPPDLHRDQPAATWVWETEGGPGHPFGSAGFLAIDPDGNLWVADDANMEFQVFGPDGHFREVWRPPEVEHESATAHEFIAVAFDQAGNLYVTNGRDLRVRKYGTDRTLFREWGGEGSGNGQFLSPSSIAVDSRGRVYVLDNGRSDVQVFDDQGNYLTTIGEFGTGEGQFLLSEGGAVGIDASDNVWVSDSGNHRLQKFSPDGQFLMSFGKYGLREQDLDDPGQIAIDGAGRIFVSAPHAQHISAFAADGTFLAAWGAEGDHAGEFFSPEGIVLDGNGYAYVSDGDDRIQKFRLKPPLVDGGTVPATPSARAGTFANIVWERHGGPDLPLYRPGDVAVDPAGNVWVVDGQRNAFQIFSPDGDYVESWGGPGNGPGEFAFWDPVVQVTSGAVAFDATGNIYVADTFNHRVQKFTPERAFVAAWGASDGSDGALNTPIHVSVAENGLVYVVDSEQAHIQVFDSDGSYVRTIGERGVGEGQLYFPLGGATALAADGTIWVADTSNHRLQAFAPDGTILAAYGGYGVSDGRFSSPNDIVIDEEGRLLVGDVGSSGVRVQAFSPAGEFLGSWSDAVGLSGGYTRLALDKQGNLYVSDNTGDRVYKLALHLPRPAGSDPAFSTPAVYGSQTWQGDGSPIV
ncbi:MAG: 6-bladed beta-propeller, partial [Thermomicrobiales bacterium]